MTVRILNCDVMDGLAAQLGMSCIGIEINPDYAAMARNPVSPNAPLFAEVAQ